MKMIWKYDVRHNSFCYSMPISATFLSVRMQGDQPRLWALLDPAARLERRHFFVLGTGFPYEDDPNDRYIGTFQMEGGAFVWHLFARVDPATAMKTG